MENLRFPFLIWFSPLTWFLFKYSGGAWLYVETPKAERCLFSEWHLKVELKERPLGHVEGWWCCWSLVPGTECAAQEHLLHHQCPLSCQLFAEGKRGVHRPGQAEEQSH